MPIKQMVVSSASRRETDRVRSIFMADSPDWKQPACSAKHMVHGKTDLKLDTPQLKVIRISVIAKVNCRVRLEMPGRHFGWSIRPTAVAEHRAMLR
jgi:hypothetical protein